MFDTRLVRLSDQSHTYAHEHHQLVMSLAGHAGFEVNGYGRKAYRVRAYLVPGEAGHVFAGVGDNHMLIIDLDEDSSTPKDPDLLARLFEAPRYPTLGADFQNLLSCVDAELTRYGSDPSLTRILDGVLIRALHLRLFGEQQPLMASGPFDPEHLDTRIMRNLARHVTIAKLAQVACPGPSHFHAQFKDSVGPTPHQYLLEVRLDCAVRLLQENRLPLVRIAKEYGFPSQGALAAAVRRYLELTPKSLHRG